MTVGDILDLTGDSYNGHVKTHSINLHFNNLNFIPDFNKAKVVFVWGNSCTV